MFFEETGEVPVKFRLPGVVLAELIVPPERVAVVMAGDIDAGARIGIFQPRPADIVVLLNDLKGDAGLFEADCGKEPRFPTTDDEDGEVGSG